MLGDSEPGEPGGKEVYSTAIVRGWGEGPLAEQERERKAYPGHLGTADHPGLRPGHLQEALRA